MIRPSRRTPPAWLCLLLVLAVPACSEGEDTEPRQADPPPATTTPDGAPTARPTRALVGKVAGTLPAPRRRALKAQVTPVVDAWFDAGFVGGEWPREVTGAYAGFTPGAARAARRDRALTSAADLGPRIDSVKVTKRAVRYDVLAPQGRPSGVTARVTLDYRTTGEVATKVMLRGRLLLSRAAGEWQVFAYDLTRDER